MCIAFSCIVDQVGKVTWKLGIDAHSELASFGGYQDRKLGEFAKAEITPKNNDYLNPDEWVFRFDESPVPAWCGTHEKELCLAAHKKWLKQMDKIIIPHSVVRPFKVTPPASIQPKHIRLLKKWDSVMDSVVDRVGASVWHSVWHSVGDRVGDSVGDSVVESVGASVWHSVVDSVGHSVWDSVGDSVVESVGASVWHSVVDSVWHSVVDSVGHSVWDSVGDSVVDSVGASVWHSVVDSVWHSVVDSVGPSVWDSVWAYTGSFFRIPVWKYVKHHKGKYPYQPLMALWKTGLVPSFDGTTWRLHGGPKAAVLFSITAVKLKKYR